MNANFEEIRDPQTHRLLGIYCQEEGIFESKQKGRLCESGSRPAPRLSSFSPTAKPQRNRSVTQRTPT